MSPKYLSISIFVFLLHLGVSSLAFAEPTHLSDSAPTVLAEFRYYDPFMDSIKITSKVKSPWRIGNRWYYINKGGYNISSDVDFNARPIIRDSNQQLLTDIQVGVSGSAWGGTTRNLGWGHTATVNVTVPINGFYFKPVFADEKGLHTGNIRGGIAAKPYINPSNTIPNRGIFRAKWHNYVNSEAYKMAVNKLSTAVPAAKKEIRDTVSQAIADTIQKADGAFGKSMDHMNAALSSPETLPLKVKLQSKSGTANNPGYLRLTMQAKDGSSSVEPTPKLKHEGQAYSLHRIHEEAIEKTLSSQVAGKQIKLKDLKEYLCHPAFGSALDFCKDESEDSKDEKTSILFQKENPVEVKFEDNALKFTLNFFPQASLRTDESSESDKLFTDPTDPKKLIFSEIPYTVEFTYKISEDRLKRTDLKVIQKPTQYLQRDQLVQSDSDSGENHEEASVLGRAGRVAKRVVNANFTAPLMATPRMRKYFDEQLKKEVITQSDPAAVESHIVNPMSKNGKRVITTKRGIMVPLETMAKDGWFVLSGYMCTENTPEFGGGFNYGKDYLIWTWAPEGSPAYGAGLRPGYIVEGYGSNPNKLKKPDSQGDKFLEFLEQAATKPTVSQRTVYISGKDNNGKAFKKTVVLCPSNLDFDTNLTELKDMVPK